MRTHHRPVPLAGLVLVAVLAAGCGGSTEESGARQTGAEQTGADQTGAERTATDGSGSDAPAPAAGGDCGRIEVPGHFAVDVQTGGEDCGTATALVEGAVGQGRQAYEVDGFSCEPADAGGGDTDYTCTRDDTRITFRYGAG